MLIGGTLLTCEETDQGASQVCWATGKDGNMRTSWVQLAWNEDEVQGLKLTP